MTVVVIPSINSRWRYSSQNTRKEPMSLFTLPDTMTPMRYNTLWTDMQSMHSQAKHTNPHAYLREHCVAFKYNCADLNTVCYSVKLQRGQSNRYLEV